MKGVFYFCVILALLIFAISMWQDMNMKIEICEKNKGIWDSGYCCIEGNSYEFNRERNFKKTDNICHNILELDENNIIKISEK